MFVVATDFDLPQFNLPNLDKVENTFQPFVDYTEEEELRKLFGNYFYDSFVAGLADLPDPWEQTVTPDGYAIGDLVVSGSTIWKSLVADNVAPIPVDTDASWEKQSANRWLLLRDGDTYKYYNRSQKWYGMKRLVVPMVYALWIRFGATSQSGNGTTIVPKSENSDTQGVGQNFSDGWNKYARLAAGDWSDMTGRLSPLYVLWPELENSLFGYLWMNSTTWDDLFTAGDQGFSDFKSYLIYSFVYPGKVNAFGI